MAGSEKNKTNEELNREIEELRARLAESDETLRAIRSGEIDALVVTTDTGERVFTLKGAEHPYRVLIEEMKEGAVTLAADDTILYCNQGFGRMLKIPLEKVMGAGILQFVSPGDRYVFGKLLRQGRSAGSKGEVTLLAKDGTPVPVHLSINSLQMDDEVPAVYIVATDLTERKQAEDALRRAHDELEMRVQERTAQLRESEQLWATTVASIGDAVISTDAEGQITFMNAVAEALTGWTLAEASTKPGNEVFNIINEYTRRKAKCPVTRALQEGTIVGLANHTILIRKDGTEVPIDDSAAPIRDGGGKTMGVVLVFRDITGRKQAENALRESEEKYRSIIETANEGIWVADAERRTIYVNNKMAEMLGYSVDEMIGKSGLDFLDEEGVALSNRNIEKRKQGIKDSYEFKLIRRDGSPLWTIVNAQPLFDKDGKFAGTLSMLTDITGRKQAEEELRRAHDELEIRIHERTAELEEANMALLESETRYRELSESINDIFFAMDKDLKYTYWNKASEVLTGIPAEDAIGKSLYEFFPDVKGTQVEQFYIEALETQQPRSFVNEYRLSDQNYIFEINVYPTRGGISVIARDVTGRRRAQEQIQEQADLLDRAHDAIMVRDMENRFVYWNKGSERLYGWTEEEALGKKASELLYKEESPRLIEARNDVITKGEWSGELRQVAKGGKEITVNSRWTLVRDSGGNPKSILIINTDITEKKNLEAQLLRAQRMESIGTLASGIAHDVNNVLTPILLSLQILEEKFTDDDSRNLINIIQRSAERGAGLIKQVQSFAKGMKGERMALQAGHIIAEISQIGKETFPRSIEIITYVNKDLFNISGDATQLHQVIMNLCVNARDAMPEGGILTISAENVFIDENYARMNIDARQGWYVAISVSDNGTGIPPEIRDRIFEPFFTTKEHGKGTGLGLSTVLAIVKGHGGFINVYSEVGKGSTFKVYLPANTTGSEISQELEPELPGGHGESILVVDDEAQIREITCATLQTYGYRVISASDGSEAVAIYAQNSNEIRAVLMDMMMPVMDGPSSIRALRKINPQVKIIAVSGLAESDKYVNIAGMVVTFLPKPYTAEKLLKTIHEVLSAEHCSS